MKTPDRTPRLLDWGDDWWPSRETVDVIVADEAGAVDTGLLDQFGQPIRRRPVRRPVGFCR
jgi:hypothetical protein